jgi:hypothetical protein
MSKFENMIPNYVLTDEERKYIRSFGIKGLKKRCYKIAQMLCMCSNGKITYCEGYLIDNNYHPIPHAWNLYNSKVIDLIALNKKSVLYRQIIGYRGFTLSYEEVKAYLNEEKGFYLIKEHEVYSEMENNQHKETKSNK